MRLPPHLCLGRLYLTYEELKQIYSSYCPIRHLVCILTIRNQNRCATARCYPCCRVYILKARISMNLGFNRASHLLLRIVVVLARNCHDKRRKCLRQKQIKITFLKVRHQKKSLPAAEGIFLINNRWQVMSSLKKWSALCTPKIRSVISSVFQVPLFSLRIPVCQGGQTY